jgi:hypothetical protein
MLSSLVDSEKLVELHGVTYVRLATNVSLPVDDHVNLNKNKMYERG